MQRNEVEDEDFDKIIASLSRAGYVKSTRGAQGGYLLSKEPEQYTIGMILRVTEGSLAPVACLEEGAAVCDRQNG